MSIRLKLTLLLTTLFVAAIFNSIMTFQLESFGEEKLQWVNHTHEVLNSANDLLGSMKDAETGQRGYLLTSDLTYLDPYHIGLVSAETGLRTLKTKTADNPGQQAILELVGTDLDLKFAELRETIQLAQSGRKKDALEIVVRNDGKRYMDNIRDLLSTFTHTELILLEERKGEFRSNRNQIYTLIIVEVAFFIGLAAFTLIFLQRNFFRPLALLLASAKKLEAGDKLIANDIIEQDEMGHLLSTFFVMGERVIEREDILGQVAYHDSLTGLKNRMLMSEEIETSIENLQETGGKIAVLFFDLNDFKEVNDSRGHEVGDLVLKETAERISSTMRSTDSVFRIGGDEFLVLARNIENISDVNAIVANLIRAFDEPAMIKGELTDINISIGVAVAPDNANNSSELMEFADVAMYAAKHEKDTNSQMFDTGMLRRTMDLSKYVKEASTS
jgi:diguanylate cyclase (GGDEF)-like protein